MGMLPLVCVFTAVAATGLPDVRSEASPHHFRQDKSLESASQPSPDEPLPEAEVGGPFAAAITHAMQRVVKIYGASIGRELGYCSGVIVAADGLIVTTLSVLLEAESVRVVLPDGRKLTAVIAARDERRQIALLKIEASDLPYFELAESTGVEPGDWVISAANPFKVAEGPEPVSVALGVLAARTTLDARRRAQDFPYDGPVLLTDLIVSAPGCTGGALVDSTGALIGVIGKPVISNRTNTWANYALPVEEVAGFFEHVRAGRSPSSRPTESPIAGARPDLGLTLLDIGGKVRPAYVERVRPNSPARRAGLRPNDLIVSIDGRGVSTCADFDSELKNLRPGQTIELAAKRGASIVTVSLTVGSRAP